MGFCAKCGAELAEGGKYCAKCGVKVGGEAWKEEFEVLGSELVDRVKALVREGNVRRVMVKDQDGRILMEFPLTVGVIGAVLAPILAALGAIAALAMRYTLIVERRPEE